MSQSIFFLPALMQILLVILLYIQLAIAKSRAVSAGLVNLERRALHADAWPESVIKINNNIRNQFEVPVLFYAITIVIWELELASTTIQILSWVFVASRCVHTWIHTGSNDEPWRRRVFTLGTAIVALMTVSTLVAVIRTWI